MTDYERLIRDFCALTGLEDATAVAGGAPIDVNGVTCSIANGHPAPSNNLMLYVEFGAVPSGREAAIYEELLAQNYLGAPQAGVMFGYSSLARRVICVQHLRASEVDAQRLVDSLHHIAGKAVEWRSTYFLKPPQGERRPTAVPVLGAAHALLAGGPAAGRTQAN
jgi:hypothetical protein